MNIKSILCGFIDVIPSSQPSQLNPKKRMDTNQEIEPNSTPKKFCLSLSQPTVSELVNLIQIHGLTKIFIQELEKFKNFKSLIQNLQSTLSNSLEPEKSLLTFCLEETFNKTNNHASTEIKELYELLCLSYIYKFGTLPEGNDQDLLEFLECKNFFDLVNRFSDSSTPKKIGSDNHFECEKLNEHISKQLGDRTPIKTLVEITINSFKSIFINDSTFPSTNIIYNFFNNLSFGSFSPEIPVNKKLTLKQCKKWISSLFNKKEHSTFSRDLALYIKILSNSQSRFSKTLPGFSIIKNGAARQLIESIECHVRGLEVKIPEKIFQDDDTESVEIVESAEGIENDFFFKSSSKIIPISPPSISSLLDLIELQDLNIPFLDEIKLTTKFNKNYKQLSDPNVILRPNERELLKIFFDVIFGPKSENSTKCQMLIDLLCWKHLYEKGHLPGNDNDQLLKFLGVNNFFELICPPPGTSKLKMKLFNPHADLETLKKFMDGLESTQHPIVKDYTLNPLIKRFTQSVISTRFSQKFHYDQSSLCKTIIHRYFHGSISTSECKSLTSYMLNSCGKSWLGCRPQYLALYLRILLSNKLTNRLPKEMPDVKSIKNEEARILVQKIESYLREDDIESIKNIEEDFEDGWEPFPDFKESGDSKTEEEN